MQNVENYEQDYQSFNHMNSKSPSYISANNIKSFENELRGNSILRQELQDCTPECSPFCGLVFNSILIILFLGVGLPIVLMGEKTIEYSMPYTTCSKNLSTSKNSVCNLTFTISENMKAPIFIYYELDNFLLNHRNFVKSKIWAQLRGEVNVDSTNNSKCVNAVYMKEMFDNNTKKYKTFTGNPLNGDDFANPCGLVAKSFFNDTYSLNSVNGSYIKINETGISNSFERNTFYKLYKDYNTTMWIDTTNGKFCFYYFENILLFGWIWKL